MIATLERERDRMTERVTCLTRNRDAIAECLDAVRRGDQTRPGNPSDDLTVREVRRRSP
ncbi:hypothetical protein AB0M95_32600 [Sphaerisporangium sp. NPDC051017]|uniref:hypothetical protein n=1 Tax=Sphaerisporangium sp. NPDC051017 TaxID=3154636 RepID=UPI0034329AA4